METLKHRIGPVPDSEFNMWRAIFAMAHADHVVTPEEKTFMNRILHDVNFTPEQEDILRQDIDMSQDVGEMFSKITDQADRSRFFYFARMLLWCDGDFDQQEQEILTTLKRWHNETVDIQEMIGNSSLELEEEEKKAIVEDMQDTKSQPLITRFFSRLTG